MRFALYKLFLNSDDRGALRYLLGSDVDDFRCIHTLASASTARPRATVRGRR